MPNIKILHLNQFFPRKRERYTTSHNGIYIVEEGVLALYQPSGEPLELKAGDFVLYHSADLDRAEAKSEHFKAMAIIFDIDLFKQFKAAHPNIYLNASERCFYPFSPQSHPHIAKLKDTLIALVNTHSPQYAQAHTALALLALMAHIQPNLLSIIIDTISPTDSQKVIRYIENHIDKDITLDTLAAHMNMSIATLKRRLAADNLSFSHILKTKRANHAATQLRVSKKSISQIAFEAGFKSAAHFSTAFKSIYGTTPKAFRSQIIGH